MLQWLLFSPLIKSNPLHSQSFWNRPCTLSPSGLTPCCLADHLLWEGNFTQAPLNFVLFCPDFVLQPSKSSALSCTLLPALWASSPSAPRPAGPCLGPWPAFSKNPQPWGLLLQFRIGGTPPSAPWLWVPVLFAIFAVWGAKLILSTCCIVLTKVFFTIFIRVRTTFSLSSFLIRNPVFNNTEILFILWRSRSMPFPVFVTFYAWFPLKCSFHLNQETFALYLRFSSDVISIEFLNALNLPLLGYLLPATWVPLSVFRIPHELLESGFGCSVRSTPLHPASTIRLPLQQGLGDAPGTNAARHRASFQSNHTPLLFKVIPWDFHWATFSSCV